MYICYGISYRVLSIQFFFFSDGFDATNRNYIRIEWRGGLGRSLGRDSMNNGIIQLGS